MLLWSESSLYFYNAYGKKRSMSMHKFINAIINFSYKVTIIRMFMWEEKKDTLNLQFTYSYKCLVIDILVLYIKLCDCYTLTSI
jgi:hypothetical protein